VGRNSLQITENITPSNIRLEFLKIGVENLDKNEFYKYTNLFKKIINDNYEFIESNLQNHNNWITLLLESAVSFASNAEFTNSDFLISEAENNFAQKTELNSAKERIDKHRIEYLRTYADLNNIEKMTENYSNMIASDLKFLDELYKDTKEGTKLGGKTMSYYITTQLEVLEKNMEKEFTSITKNKNLSLEQKEEKINKLLEKYIEDIIKMLEKEYKDVLIAARSGQVKKEGQKIWKFTKSLSYKVPIATLQTYLTLRYPFVLGPITYMEIKMQKMYKNPKEYMKKFSNAMEHPVRNWVMFGILTTGGLIAQKKLYPLFGPKVMAGTKTAVSTYFSSIATGIVIGSLVHIHLRTSAARREGTIQAKDFKNTIGLFSNRLEKSLEKQKDKTREQIIEEQRIKQRKIEEEEKKKRETPRGGIPGKKGPVRL
jgi:hypothetical protein